MTADAKPIFVFVPGAWHTPDTFDIIRDLLRQRGHDTDAVANQSAGAADPSRALRALADQGCSIVVVAHSYGGIVAAGAVEGLGYTSRARAGQPGGVIQVVWMAAFVTPKDKSLLEMLGGNWLSWMSFTTPDDGYVYTTQPTNIFYHDMTPDAQRQAIANLPCHPKPSFLEPAVHEPWREIPVFYLFCDQDQALPLAAQEAFAQTLGNPGRYHVDGSHSAFLSLPEHVADGLVLALTEGLEKTGAGGAGSASGVANRVSQ
ncbi:alpha/beta-hydrolase [Aspergillus uvarum CBS 121591]|uniref:Alpha/beta-hydrolase n=1 Tax=Aspergillus uvarum CBS 121591 TaxID=1448315 RepID=A0A319DTK7_9EURO|nr:alpha/beta-hydrolase [Aspergillus uvarum CBS 121591]PYH82492.1 alpha/beta-hydrolase [Aspergillus uvarum CBS 121591]